MAVMARQAWTDERLDDFRVEVNNRFDQVDKRFDHVDKRMERLEDRFDALQRTMILGFFSINASMIGVVILT